MTDHAKRLTQLAGNYAAAERAVIAAFFRQPLTPRHHLRWLRAQAFKEYSAIKPIFTALAKLYPRIDCGIDRHDYEELTVKLADETKHARLVMDLLEEIGGKKVTCKDLLWLPEDRKLARVRARYSASYAALLHGSGTISAKEMRRQDETLERAAITLTEGGGGALYQVCSKLPGKDSISKKIAAVFRQILIDEMGHKDSGVRALAPLVKSEKAWHLAQRIICDVSGQRLRMRSEQFGFPLNDTEIAELNRRARAMDTRVDLRPGSGTGILSRYAVASCSRR